MSQPQDICIVALGANIPSPAGSPEVTLHNAASRLFSMFAKADPSPGRLSSLYRSTPVDCPPGTPDFINAVAILPLPPMDAQDFLRHLLKLEADYGRDRQSHEQTHSRPLDLDLIAYGPLITHLNSPPPLILPHPRAHLRRFVLDPLTELLPDYRLPGIPTPIPQLLNHLP